MNRALFAAASGMAAEQEHLDTVAANLANADITAFSGQMVALKSVRAQDGRVIGVATDGTQTTFSQGRLEHSGGPCDIALRGNGFFVVQRAGEIGYTRAGSFHRAADGTLQNTDGWHLAGVRVPASAQHLTITMRGEIRTQDAQNATRQIGTLRVAEFDNVQALAQRDPATFTATRASGAAHLQHAGNAGGPEIVFGTLEHSNVSIITSMMEILDAQRAYEADAKGVQAADEMVRIANNLQRG